MKTFRFDTETYPIRPGLLAPKMVCIQYAFDDDVKGLNGDAQVRLRDDPNAKEHLLRALRDEGVLLEAHNGAYDQAVTAAVWPETLPLWFRALGAKRGRDTMLRETLNDIRLGTLQQHKPKGYFSLAGIAKRRLGRDIDKSEDSWRLKYALLDGVPTKEWPSDAMDYALGDVTTLRDVSRHQLKEFVPEDEWLQVAAAFCLQLAAVWGVRCDPEALDVVAADLILRRDAAHAILDQAGFFRTDGTTDKAKVQAAIERACLAALKPVPRTDKGAIKYDAATCEELAPHEPALTALAERTTTMGFLSKYIEPMKGGVSHAMNSRPNVLVSSGRTSWGGSKLTDTNPWWSSPSEGWQYSLQEHQVGANLQNFPQLKGIRDCIIPRLGRWFWSVDWSSLELRTLGQVVLWITGKSKLASRYQADPNYDPHSEFAADLMGITYDEAIKLKKAGDKRFKEFRQLAKAAMFGYPGGLGARTFVTFAHDQYGVTLTENEAKELKAKWLRTWPEMVEYFQYISWLAETGRPYRQWVSGRLRGGVGFCDGCNTGFQGLGGDAAKLALIRVSQACYVEPSSPLFGSRVVVLVHDELIGESDIELAPEACMEVVRLMNLSLADVTPDVPPGAEPTLMSRWIKEAAPKYGADGRLTAWDL